VTPLVIEERDVVIVGGGIAGLTAALHLSDLSPLVLESDERVGGRILSKQRGDLALSVGAHMFPPPDSVVGKLVTEFGLEVMPITGSMLNIHYRGKLIRDTRPELFPFLLPLSLPARLSFAKAGLRVRQDAKRYMELIRPRPGDTSTAPWRTARSPSPARSHNPRWPPSSATSGTPVISGATCAAARAGCRRRSAPPSARRSGCGPASARSR
jgi:phytoene dehydrogenase-like protein